MSVISSKFAGIRWVSVGFVLGIIFMQLSVPQTFQGARLSLLLPVTTNESKQATIHLRIHDIVQSYQGSPYVKILWMYWDRGFDHLNSVPDEKYQADYKCVQAWQIMNPHWHIFLLDKDQARKIAPNFARLFSGRKQAQVTPAHAADLLRLELLTRYGGIWSDTSICPFKPLDSWIPKLLDRDGFFFPLLAGTRAAGDTYGDALREKHGNCRFEPLDNRASSSRSGSNFFIAAAHQHNVVIEGWFKALLASLEEIGRCKKTIALRSSSGDNETEAIGPCVYPYFITHCAFTQLRVANKTVEEKWQRFVKSGRAGSWANVGRAGVCFANGRAAYVNYAKRWCYFVKKQEGQLRDFVLSDSYLNYTQRSFGSGKH